MKSGVTSSLSPNQKASTSLRPMPAFELLRMGNQSGHITPNDKMGGGDTYVTVNNNTSNTKTTTRESSRANGDRDIMVLIEDVVANSVNTGGKVHDAVQRRFQLNPGGSTPRY